jgi:hypothetical protein
MNNTLEDQTRSYERSQRAGARVAWALGCDTSLSIDPVATMREKGFSRYMKAGDVTTAGDVGVALAPLNAAFLAQVDQQSLPGQMAGVVRIPINAAARLQLGEVVATKMAEGDEKPVVQMGFDVAGPPSKVQAQIVISAEAVRGLDATTFDAITQVLISAVGRATDVELIRVLTAGVSTGLATPAALLSAISGGQPRRPYVIGGLDVILGLPVGTVRDLESIGVRVLFCAAAAGVLVAVDASGLLVSEGDLQVDTARHANLVIDTVGGSPSTPVNTSLWQSNLVALRVERMIRFAVRAGAVAFASTGSPA